MQSRHDMPFGATVLPGGGGVRFRLWAPSADAPVLELEDRTLPMPAVGDGWCELTVPEARAGDRYRYRIGDGALVPDPASRFQPEDASGPSLVVDPASYDWNDAGWHGLPWEDTVIYELHVGTFTPEGTYAGIERRLSELKSLGITAIELMPIGDFAGSRNWGYDGVLPYAPESAYGTPEDLKRLVDRAHALGIMVFLDVVYNHFGPAGNYLGAYAASFFTQRHQTPWGDGINVDGHESGRTVRDYFIHNALYWLEEYRFDGLRFDAVHAIADDSQPHLVAELAQRIRAAFPGRQIHLMLENEENTASWLERGADGRPLLHSAQWADDIHHGWHVALTGEGEAYYADYTADPVGRLSTGLAEGFVFQGQVSEHRGAPRGEPSAHLPPTAFIAFLQNHDQIGNRALGERLDALAPPEAMQAARAGLLLAPQIPMLFMGEEWAAGTPFQFFVDFSGDPALADAVRDGRTREFEGFSAYNGETVPDPGAESTFAASRLDWAERSRAPHAAVLAEVKALLALRRAHVQPLLRSAFHGGRFARHGTRMLDVRWDFAAGTLRLVANLSDIPAALPELEPAARTIYALRDAGNAPAAWSLRVTLQEALT